MKNISAKETIKYAFLESKIQFHNLIDTISDKDFYKQSRNSGWTNGELFFHITFGFIVVSALLPLVIFFSKLPKTYSQMFAKTLNFSTPLFNVINALGAKGGAKIYKKKKLIQKFDKTIDALLNVLENLNMEDLKRGMYFPKKWDGLFDEFMTLEKLFYYPIKHFKFHKGQIKTL